MYTPNHFQETDNTKLLGLLRANPLGTLVVATETGLLVNHIPFVADVAKNKVCRLRAHVPRANPLTSELSAARDAVVIFQGANGYISPSWYATKPVHGKVVPTWNYTVVHMHGSICIRDEADWVEAQLEELTQQNESARPAPWSVADAPADYIKRMIAALVGLEVTVTRIEGKTKASQNQPAENQASVLAALESEQPASELLAMMRTALEDTD
jgi:transcriptional regulator